MNKDNRTKLNKVVKFLTTLHFKPENIMVTGSIALDASGVLPKNRTTHDVDLIMKIDDQSWRCMKLLEAINNADNEVDSILAEKYPEERNKILIFKFSDIVLNIWKYDGEWSEIKDCETGVYVATVDHIIKAKKMYSRPKDYQDISDICKNIL